tara:strand:+ start:119 stop:418 length:300 start_codon:yes stop_codon:yes gene_type:complete
MNKFIPMILAVVMVSSTTYAFAEEYDLSDHPVYNWTWNEDINFSNERYSNPKSSNDYTLAYSLSILKVEFDPTHIYYEKPVMSYDYCDMEQFAKYPRCR